MRDTVFEDTVFGGPFFGESPSGDSAEDPFADLPGATALPQNPVTVAGFDPAEDILVIALEDTGEDAVIETRPTRDGRGTDVLVNGLRVATVPGVPGLSPADIGQILV
ncbi:MAG: hypothetical protein RIA08_16910 [Roseovarius sp.]|uniref:hypothetical protein n=1 Tax=Roseovarius sp. TaxID=1486281 RepID=UPI0032ED6B25